MKSHQGTSTIIIGAFGPTMACWRVDPFVGFAPCPAMAICPDGVLPDCECKPARQAA
jgi:hypothetical protein